MLNELSVTLRNASLQHSTPANSLLKELDKLSIPAQIELAHLVMELQHKKVSPTSKVW